MKLFLLLFLLSSSTLFAAEASLSKISGKVTVDGKTAKEGMSLSMGETVSTLGKGNSAEISFSDGSRMLLRNGVLEIKRPATPKQTLVQLVKGILFSSKEKSGSSLKVQTKYASMGIRGTKFYVDQQENETYLCVCEGTVEIANGVSTALVSQNEDAHVTMGKKFNKSQASSMMMDMAQDGFKEMGLLK